MDVARTIQSLFLLVLVEQHGVDVAFKMIDGDERQPLREGQRLGVGNAHQQRTGQAGTRGDGDGVQICEGDAGLG